jgi:hypothetical protein
MNSQFNVRCRMLSVRSITPSNPRQEC